MKLERILAIAGIILLLVITIAIINTYTDLFKEVFKEFIEIKIDYESTS